MLYFIQLIPPASLLLSEGKQKRSRSGGEERREGKLGVEGGNVFHGAHVLDYVASRWASILEGCESSSRWKLIGGSKSLGVGTSL